MGPRDGCEAVACRRQASCGGDKEDGGEETTGKPAGHAKCTFVRDLGLQPVRAPNGLPGLPTDIGTMCGYGRRATKCPIFSTGSRPAARASPDSIPRIPAGQARVRFRTPARPAEGYAKGPAPGPAEAPAAGPAFYAGRSLRGLLGEGALTAPPGRSPGRWAVRRRCPGLQQVVRRPSTRRQRAKRRTRGPLSGPDRFSTPGPTHSSS